MMVWGRGWCREVAGNVGFTQKSEKTEYGDNHWKIWCKMGDKIVFQNYWIKNIKIKKLVIRGKIGWTLRWTFK